MNREELQETHISTLRSKAADLYDGDLFKAKKNELIECLLASQRAPEPVKEEKPKFEGDDIRLRTKPPAKNPTTNEIKEACKHYIDKGLVLTFPEQDQFHMRFSKKEDSGNIRQPLRNIVRLAEVITR